MPSSDTITFQSSLRTWVCMKCLCSLSHGTSSPKFLDMRMEKLSSRWKAGLQLSGHGASQSVYLRVTRPFVVKAVATIPQLDKAPPDSQEEHVNVESELQNRPKRLSLDDIKETDPVNYQRRLRISKANKGKVPWNKGRKHSPETIARIRERTRQAMQDSKIRKKLGMNSHPQSEETRKKIGLSLKMTVRKRQKKKKIQQTCLHEWEESLAEAARIGGDGEDELQWDSYEIIKEKIRQDWMQGAEMRKKNQRAPKPAEHKKKISEAIKAKWADPDYRQRVHAGFMKHLEKRPQAAVRKAARKQSSKVDVKLPSDKIPAKTPVKRSEYEQFLDNYRMKSPAPYSDPLTVVKLDKIKQLRTDRAAIEIKKHEAVERARLLIAEAEKAAKTLEAAAVKDDIARASLFETRKLLAEAVQTMQSVQPHLSGNEHTSIRSPVTSFDEKTLQADTHMNSSHIAPPLAPEPGDEKGACNLSFSGKCKASNSNDHNSNVTNFINGTLSGTIFHSAHKSNHSKETGEEKVLSYSTLFSAGNLSVEKTALNFKSMPDKGIGKDSMSHSEDNSAPTLMSADHAGTEDEPIIVNTAEKHTRRDMEDQTVSLSSNSVASKGPNQSIAGMPQSQSLEVGHNDHLDSNKNSRKMWVRGRLVEVKRD